MADIGSLWLDALEKLNTISGIQAPSVAMVDGVFNRGLETRRVGESFAKKVQIFRDTGYRLGKLCIWEMSGIWVRFKFQSPRRLVSNQLVR